MNLLKTLALGSLFAASSVWGHYFPTHNVELRPAHASGQCVDVSGQSHSDGANVFIWRCLNANNQKFNLIPYGGFYQIQAVHSGKCLEVSGSSRNNGANFQQRSCNFRNNQLFSINPSPVMHGAYELQAAHSSKCMDVAGRRTTDRTNVQQWDCLGYRDRNALNQAFYIQGSRFTPVPPPRPLPPAPAPVPPRYDDERIFTNIHVDGRTRVRIPSGTLSHIDVTLFDRSRERRSEARVCVATRTIYFRSREECSNWRNIDSSGTFRNHRFSYVFATGNVYIEVRNRSNQSPRQAYVSTMTVVYNR